MITAQSECPPLRLSTVHLAAELFLQHFLCYKQSGAHCGGLLTKLGHDYLEIMHRVGKRPLPEREHQRFHQEVLGDLRNSTAQNYLLRIEQVYDIREGGPEVRTCLRYDVLRQIGRLHGLQPQ